MYNNERSVFSPLKIVIIVLLSIIIAISITVNLLFLKSHTPRNMFGKTLLLIETDEMMPEIAKNTIIIADKDETTNLEKGNVIMYNYTDAENKTKTAVSRIYDIVSEADGTYYHLKVDNTKYEGTVEVLEKDILAKCNFSSKEFGFIVSSLKSTVGIALFLILPSIILIIIIITSSINARKQRNGLFDDYDIPVMLERMPKKRKQVSTPLFEANDDINSSEDFLAKKESISENFSQKRVSKKTGPHNMDTELKKAKTDEVKKKVLFDINDDEDVEVAKRKATERLQRAEQFNPQGDFSEYRRRNAEAMKAAEKAASDNKVKVTQVNINNTPDAPAKNNIDEKATAIKLALQKRAYDDAGATETIPTESKAAEPKQTVAKKANSSTKMDDIKNRYINQTNKNTSSSKSSATFEDLMRVLENEKKKLD